VLFVHGRDSPVVTPEGLADVRAANPDAAVAGIDDAGHMIPWDNLEDFIAVVRAFLPESGPWRSGSCPRRG
jgi:N-formylmaleamate deformylase